MNQEWINTWCTSEKAYAPHSGIYLSAQRDSEHSLIWYRNRQSNYCTFKQLLTSLTLEPKKARAGNDVMFESYTNNGKKLSSIFLLFINYLLICNELNQRWISIVGSWISFCHYDLDFTHVIRGIDYIAIESLHCYFILCFTTIIILATR